MLVVASNSDKKEHPYPPQEENEQKGTRENTVKEEPGVKMCDRMEGFLLSEMSVFSE